MVVNNNSRRPIPQEYEAQQAAVERGANDEVRRQFNAELLARHDRIEAELRRQRQQVEQIRQEAERLQAQRLGHEFFNNRPEW
jgi:PleD family two-component response regulator